MKERPKTQDDLSHPPGDKGHYQTLRSIVILAWPVVIEMGLHTFTWIFDTAMVMRLGAREATAVEYGALLFFNTLMILGALGIGTNALVARYTGAGDNRRAALTGGQALSLSLIITLLFTFTALLGQSWLFSRVIADGATAALTSEYFYYVLICGGPAILPLLVAGGIIRGRGNTRVPMLIALIANSYNVIGDYLLIFGHFGFPALGVRGAAIATGSAQLLALALALGYLLLWQRDLPLPLANLFPLRRAVLAKILRLSIPAGAEELTHSGSRVISASWLTALGPVAFAANAAAIAAESFSFMPGHGIAIAATTLVGQRLGSGLIEQARKTGYWAVALGTALMSFTGLLFLSFPYVIMGLFNPPDPEVLRLGALCLQIAAVEQPFIAMTMIFSGALKGTGDTRGPFKVGLYSNLIVRLPLIYLFVYVLNLEIYYIWWATAAQYVFSSLLLFRLYRAKNWETLEPLPSMQNVG